MNQEDWHEIANYRAQQRDEALVEVERLRDEIVWMRERAERAEAKADLYWQHLPEEPQGYRH